MSESINVVQFLVELRSRLIYSLVLLLVLFGFFSYYANDLYSVLAMPLLKYLPQKHLIATQLMSPFLVPFKLAFMSSVILTTPFFLYQLWIFISPALYGHERQLIWPSLLISIVLFYLGILFAYFLIFPALFQFLTATVPASVLISPDISDYLDFTIKLLLGFGCLFEIPMLMVLLVSLNIVTQKRFRQSRSYAIVGAFILGMLLAPPDVLSQTIIAVPIWLLYEMGILLSACIAKHPR